MNGNVDLAEVEARLVATFEARAGEVADDEAAWSPVVVRPRGRLALRVAIVLLVAGAIAAAVAARPGTTTLTDAPPTTEAAASGGWETTEFAHPTRGTFRITWLGPTDPDQYDEWEPVEVGGRPAWYRTYPYAPGVSALVVQYEDGVLGVFAADLTREEMLAVAAGARRTATGFEATWAPDGFAPIYEGPVEG